MPPHRLNWFYEALGTRIHLYRLSPRFGVHAGALASTQVPTSLLLGLCKGIAVGSSLV